MALKSKVEILNALKAKLEALVYTAADPVDASFVGQKVVEAVELFDEGAIEKAVSKLLNFKKRIGVLVPLVTDLDTKEESGVLRTETSFELVCIVTDKAYGVGNRDVVFGNAEYPGTLNMGHVVLQGLMGVLDLSEDSTPVIPLLSQSIRMAEKEEDLSKSREGYNITFEIPTGVLKTTLRRGRRLNG